MKTPFAFSRVACYNNNINVNSIEQVKRYKNGHTQLFENKLGKL